MKTNLLISPMKSFFDDIIDFIKRLLWRTVISVCVCVWACVSVALILIYIYICIYIYIY